MLIWIIGVPGAGKSLVAKRLKEKLQDKFGNFIHIDGDEFRKIMGNDLGYSLEDRKKNGERIVSMGKFLIDSNVNVIVSILSIFHDHQDWNRETIKDYYEIFLDVNEETILSRNQKKLYTKKDYNKNIVGRSIEFIVPKNPNLVIKNNNDDKLDRVVDKIYQNIKIKFLDANEQR